MFLLARHPPPSPVSNALEVELVGGLIHIKAIGLSRTDAIEQAIQGSVGILCFLSVAALVVYLLSIVLRPGEGERRERSLALKRFLRTDNGVYCLCLLVCDMCPAFSGISNIYWSTQFRIHHSRLCDFQGSGNQFGSCGVAFWNLALAVQTFSLLVVRYQPPKWVKWVVFALGWTFATLMTIIGPIQNDSPFSFFGPNSSGCWLTFGSSHFVEWYLAVSGLFLGVLFVMLILYAIIFLSLSGALDTLRGKHKIPSQTSSQTSQGQLSAEERQAREIRKIAKRMLWFPLAYGVLSLPLTVSILLAARKITLGHVYYSVSELLWVFNSGADVIIFILTRHHLLRPSSTSHLHPDANPNLSTSAPHDDDIEPTGLQLSPLPYIRTVHNDLATSPSPHSSSFTQQQFRLSTLDEEDGGAGNVDVKGREGRRVSSPTSGLERKARGERGEDARGLVRR